VIAAGKTAEETEKRLGALLRDGVPIVSIDNVGGELGGDMFCQITERPLVRIRILGVSEAPEFECKATVFATGNNVVLVGDMARRAVLCSLGASVERPELRRFAFDPIARVLESRGTYVAAAITIARAYRAAGSPEICSPIGSYGQWSKAVRSPLIWLGEADPIASMETARGQDPELMSIRELFGHWRTEMTLNEGYTSNSIIQVACKRNADDTGFLRPEFRDLLLRVAGDGGAVSSRRLGKWLSRISGRIVDGCRLVTRTDTSHGNRFSLCEVKGGA
jgi:putative DNA primase/helicase